jgi:hypothetical protein
MSSVKNNDECDNITFMIQKFELTFKKKNEYTNSDSSKNMYFNERKKECKLEIKVVDTIEKYEWIMILEKEDEIKLLTENFVQTFDDFIKAMKILFNNVDKNDKSKGTYCLVDNFYRMYQIENKNNSNITYNMIRNKINHDENDILYLFILYQGEVRDYLFNISLLKTQESDIDRLDKKSRDALLSIKNVDNKISNEINNLKKDLAFGLSRCKYNRTTTCCNFIVIYCALFVLLFSGIISNIRKDIDTNMKIIKDAIKILSEMNNNTVHNNKLEILNTSFTSLKTFNNDSISYFYLIFCMLIIISIFLIHR